MLNEKAAFIESLAPELPIVIEVSFERLLVLCQLENSIFKSSHVFPSLKYFLKAGEEDTCVSELEKLIETLQKYEGIQMMCSIAVDRPFPDLSKLLELFKMHPSLIRIVLFSLERSPKQLLECLKNPPTSSLFVISLNNLKLVLISWFF